MNVKRIEKTDNGWLIKHDRGYVHLTPEWLDAIDRDQCQVNDLSLPALNRLRYNLRYGDPTEEEVSELFAEMYGTIINNREDRTALGLKAVTRHGHADLEAVRNGAEVRPWNASRRRSTLTEWIDRDKSNR